MRVAAVGVGAVEPLVQCAVVEAAAVVERGCVMSSALPRSGTLVIRSL